MTWKIEITDVLVKYVEVDANSKEEAIEKSKEIILDPKSKKDGGDRIKRKTRIYNHFVFIAKYEGNDKSEKEEFLTVNNGKTFLSERGTEFAHIEDCKSTMLNFDKDRRNWKVIRLKRL